MKAIIILVSLAILFSTNLHSQTNWIELQSNTTNDLHGVQFVNSSTGYAVGSNKTVLKTTNSGTNWLILDVGLGSSPNFYSVSANNADTVYVVGLGVFLKTSNGGLNWTSSLQFGGRYASSIHFVSTSIAYAACDERLDKTINKGNSWSPVYFSNQFLKSVFFINSNIGIVAGYHKSPVAGVIYKTTNSGIDWFAMAAPPIPPLTDVKFVSENIGYIAAEWGRILKTTNQGINWTSIPVLGVTDDFWGVEFIDANTGFLVGEGSTIAKTIDGGQNWEVLVSPSNRTLNDVQFVNSNTGFAVGEGGTIIKTTNGSTSFNGIRVNMKSINEGLYFPLFNSLSRKDTVSLYLRSSSSPYSLIDSAKGTIDSTSFSGLFNFSNAPSGNYYIVVKHFQSIETWSKPGGEVLTNNGSIYNYDFTTSSSQAYGNNLKLKGSKYCVYTGDLNQSGFIDATELSMVENDAANFLTGRFVLTDLNGDEIVDASDYLIVDNNAYNFVGVIRP